MDFDPSAFLSMAMTEDQDAVYTAPDVPQGFSPVKIPAGKIVVEGGLQMEQDVQIPVPVFGLLQQNEEEVNQNNETDLEAPIHIDITEPEKNTTPQPSPGERTLSPCSRKVIHATAEETRFRKDLFCGHYERVKIFRLHCSICDCHLGCAPWYTERQMRMHKLLSVVVCRKCFEFYGDINFPIEDGSELYCCWCGEGGECFCCSTCAKIVCKKCVKRNFGSAKVKEIDKNDDWSCFVCKPEDIWPHRALMWGLQRWGRGMRQLVAMFPKEEKQAKLSLDTSHCCLKSNQDFTSVGLPPKPILSKIPTVMIAVPYHNSVREILARQDAYTSTSNGVYPVNSHISRGGLPMNNLRPMMPETVTRVPVSLPQQVQLGTYMSGYEVNVRQKMQHAVQRNTIVMSARPAPYPMSRNMTPMLHPPPPPQPPQYPSRIVTYQTQRPYTILPPLNMNPSHQSDVIDVERDSVLRRKLQPSLIDISSLENCVGEVKDVLRPTLMMLDQFDELKHNLANDFGKLTSYSERLSYNIKIAICNLAKTNTDLIEFQKKIIDSRVSTVVNSVQSTVDIKMQPQIVNNVKSFTTNETLNPMNWNGNESSPKGYNPQMIVDSSPEIIEVNPDVPLESPEYKTSSSGNKDHTTPSTPVSSTGEEVEDVTVAMLCETVLEVEENKENKDDANKDQTTPVKEPQLVNNKETKGKPQSKTNFRKRTLDSNVSSKIQVIDLIDEDEEEEEKGKKGEFDEFSYCKKFNIVPCKVLLERLEVVKVEVV